ncbi:TIGR01777 family protein [Paeniglutamicibacter gangotriensis]|uniref:TIGR01777 family protein n=1 Tax=Paeniglutamicibacter gangotriensis TaxID=254787 RepID=A0A5B0EMD4_9MICC|nr:TIGR01777 family oxidoreductase [Paeniglutamicibacter gangotriensis]KAA0978910.1 TIGR01777 family protein [Paeniglutamicibacter gangotriensis]
MAIFEYTTKLPYPREKVFAWFSRPGALPRLWAPYLGTVSQEPDMGLAVGSRAVLDVAAPGTMGTALAAATDLGARTLGLPARIGARIPWRAKHISLNPGHDFTDIMESGPLARWEHQHFFADDDHHTRPGTVMRDVVEFELPVLSRSPFNRARALAEKAFTRELNQVFRYRERMLRADLAFHENYASEPLVIAVAGASGVIGTQLCALLGGGGHRIIKLVRHRSEANGHDAVFWDPERGVLDPEQLRDVDAVVNLAGHTIGGRFTADTKEKILSSRVLGTELLAGALATLAADGKQRSYIVASGIGIYGAAPHTGIPVLPLDEDTAPGTDFLAEVCTAWEQACAPAAAAGVRVVNVRTGLVQTPAGGILAQMLPLYALGLGGPLGTAAWQSWIGLDDVVGIYAHALLTESLAGPVNAVAPSPVQSEEYARTLGKVLRRPARIPVPGFAPKLLLGSQGAAELAFSDQRVASTKIEASGYGFRQPELESALRHVLGHS